MSGYAAAGPGPAETPSGHGARRSSVSLPFLFVAVALIAAGIMLYTEFMLTFSLEYLPSVLLFLVGGLMLFHPLSGADRSD